MNEDYKDIIMNELNQLTEAEGPLIEIIKTFTEWLIKIEKILSEMKAIINE